MDHKELRELIEVISKSNFSAFELEREGFKLKMVKDNGVTAVVPSGSPSAPRAPLPATPETEPETGAATAPAVADETLVEVTSPIVGTFYDSPSPDAPAFVSVGGRVRKGQILCIVEAMKLMNEIEAEIEAEMVEVLATNGQPVEFGDVLFRLRPLSP